MDTVLGGRAGHRYSDVLHYGGKRSANMSNPLDPIEVAGCFRAEDWRTHVAAKVAEQHGAWMTLLLAFFSVGIVSTLGVDEEKRQQATPITSAAKWKRALEYLADTSVRVLKSAGGAKIFARYFQTPKDHEVDRAIFDCRTLNNLVPKSRPVYLASIEEITDILRFFRTPSIATADLRHWFYQIKLHGEDRRWFGVMIGVAIWVMRVLAMGFSWSPWIGQAIAMSLVLANCPYEVSTPRGNKSSPPPFVVLRHAGKVVCFVVIFYDNFLVVAANSMVRNQMLAHIERNAKACGVIFKTSPKHPHPFRKWDREKRASAGDYLGMQIEIADNRMTISHTEKNIHSWRADGALTMSSTNRDVAQVIGRIIWDACLRMTPFGSIADIIGQLRKVSAAEEDDAAWWERKCGLLSSDIAAINQARKELLRNKSTTLEMCPKQALMTIMAAADASDWGMGGALLDEGTCGDNSSCRRQWTKEERALPIHHREIRAAIETVKWIHNKRPGEKTIILAEDNAVARVALTKSYMCDATICKELTKFHEWKQQQGINLIVIQVTSADQAADEDSRNMRLDPERCARCIECLMQAPIVMTVLGRKRARNTADE